ncbi:MAG: Trm112 family protein [Spirochaetota bacterium]
MIDSKLLNMLACPYCRGNVEYDTKEAVITCQECGLVYPVVDKIPVMIIEKAVNYKEKKDAGELQL